MSTPDFSQYEKIGGPNGKKFAIFPFSDWFPPDFEDVLVNIKGEPAFDYEIMYYSPGCNKMAMEVPGEIGQYLMPAFYSPESLSHWLKELRS